jgi:RNA polymerase-associated protein RTF1
LLNSSQSDLETYKQSLAENNSKVPTQSFLKKKYDDIKALENLHWTDEHIKNKLQKQKKYEHLLRPNSLIAPSSSANVDEQARRIYDLNQKNRIRDSQRVRQALLDEQRQRKQEQKKRDLEFRKKMAEEEAKKAEEEKKKLLKVPGIDDLFEGSDRSRSATPAMGRSGTPKPAEKREKKGLPTFRKPKMEDEIIAAIDIDVDIVI